MYKLHDDLMSLSPHVKREGGRKLLRQTTRASFFWSSDEVRVSLRRVSHVGGARPVWLHRGTRIDAPRRKDTRRSPARDRTVEEGSRVARPSRLEVGLGWCREAGSVAGVEGVGRRKPTHCGRAMEHQTGITGLTPGVTVWTKEKLGERRVSSSRRGVPGSRRGGNPSGSDVLRKGAGRSLFLSLVFIRGE